MQILTSIIAVVLLLVGVFVITSTKRSEDSTMLESNEQVEQSDTADVITAGSALDLSGQQLTQVPSYIFDQTNLKTLDLSNNRLTGALQAEVRHLIKLQVLDLSDNNFTGVPAEIGQLTRLEVLDLSNNQLTGLPHELGNLKNLNTLDLRGNNPSEYDLEIIKEALPGTQILVD